MAHIRTSLRCLLRSEAFKTVCMCCRHRHSNSPLSILSTPASWATSRRPLSEEANVHDAPCATRNSPKAAQRANQANQLTVRRKLHPLSYEQLLISIPGHRLEHTTLLAQYITRCHFHSPGQWKGTPPASYRQFLEPLFCSRFLPIPSLGPVPSPPSQCLTPPFPRTSSSLI